MNTRFERTAVTVQTAKQLILAQASEAGIERVSLENAYGRILADHVTTVQPVPHFRRSGMDGYAVRSVDTAGATKQSRVRLEVTESVACGQVPLKDIQAGQAARVMTGAVVPDGADAVIMLEMTNGAEDGDLEEVWIEQEMKLGENVTAVGFEAQSGDLLIEKGARIGAGETAILASCGYAQVPVFKCPVVAIISTGSELLPVDEPLTPGKIRNSNMYMLAALVQSEGGVPILVGSLDDDAESVERSVSDSLKEADIVMTTGGVSVGDHDVMVDVLNRLDGRLLFNKVSIRPGSPTTAYIQNGKLVLALSGNPTACFVGFELFARPVLAAMQGKAQPVMPSASAILMSNDVKTGLYERYVPSRTFVRDGVTYVEPAVSHRSSATIAIKDADCLLVVPSGGAGIKRGEPAAIVPLPARF